jgi:hypothetical protein
MILVEKCAILQGKGQGEYLAAEVFRKKHIFELSDPPKVLSKGKKNSIRNESAFRVFCERKIHENLGSSAIKCVSYMNSLYSTFGRENVESFAKMCLKTDA